MTESQSEDVQKEEFIRTMMGKSEESTDPYDKLYYKIMAEAGANWISILRDLTREKLSGEPEDDTNNRSAKETLSMIINTSTRAQALILGQVLISYMDTPSALIVADRAGDEFKTALSRYVEIAGPGYDQRDQRMH